MIKFWLPYMKHLFVLHIYLLEASSTVLCTHPFILTTCFVSLILIILSFGHKCCWRVIQGTHSRRNASSKDRMVQGTHGPRGASSKKISFGDTLVGDELTLHPFIYLVLSYTHSGITPILHNSYFFNTQPPMPPTYRHLQNHCFFRTLLPENQALFSAG